MSSKKFQRTKENFICEKCGLSVIGDGYTNHCSDCLWSKHVDKNPGDRLEKCEGMMRPVSVEIKSGEYIIHHQCVKCGFKNKVKAMPEDNFDEILKLSTGKTVINI